MEIDKIIETTFKVVVILASLGVAGAAVKKVFTVAKKIVFWTSEIEKRVSELEKVKTRKRKRKPKTKN